MIGSIVYLIICLIKKKEKKVVSYTLLSTFIIMILGALLLPTVEDETAKADKEESISKEEPVSKIEKKKEIKFTIENHTIETDENGKAVIKGTIDKDANLIVDGKEITKNTNGDFTYDVFFEDKMEHSKKITLYASKKGYEDMDYIVTVFNNTKIYKEKMAKEAEAAAKKAEEDKKAREKEEAIQKAKEEEEARKEAEKERIGVEGQLALKKAEQYSEIMHMSKAGIYDQLTSEYGEKFSTDAAQYAIDNLEADYNENALAKAKEYQEIMSMSAESIRDQLTSEYGEKFTKSEADYAITHLYD